MLTSTEQLIEAVSYAEEEGGFWWEVFDSPKQARQVLAAAIIEDADEYQMVTMLAAKDIDMFDSYTIEETYAEVLQELREEIEDLT